MTNTRFISFYSYKGGSGRSTTCINTILHMISEYKATPKKPILLVDADIESAGLTYYFKSESKFTDQFEKAIHTTKILTKMDECFDGINTNYIFENNLTYHPIPDDIINSLKKYLKEAAISGDVNEIFYGVRLNLVEINLFRLILQYKLKNAASEDMPINEQVIASTYMIGDLVGKLSEANRKFLDSDRMLLEKRKIIVDFLPAYSFRDISEYFGVAPGTVRFLGVDVDYFGVLSIPSNVTEAFQKMRNVCKVNDVCAVIFDCSAGTQCTAHMLHSFSDVIVYCMRPSFQFVEGTLLQLKKYNPMLIESSKIKNTPFSNKKMVILLPTAVPNESEYAALGENSFLNINEIANTYRDIVDNTFCKREEALNEVALFKWREYILGVKNNFSDDDTIKNIVKRFESPDSMPEDAKHAYYVYKKLAACIAKNSGGN